MGPGAVLGGGPGDSGWLSISVRIGVRYPSLGVVSTTHKIHNTRRLRMTGELNLRAADKLEVTILVDNYTDLLLLQGTEVVKRSRIPPPHALLAEHGLSCLVKVYADSEEHVVLVDAGIAATCLFHNADLLKVDLS
jgi:hypothetical protein